MLLFSIQLILKQKHQQKYLKIFLQKSYICTDNRR
jgi:hypothetical protein